MTKYFRRLGGWVMGAALAIGFSSCAYDPYYSSTTVGGSYTSGYGDGYGYGGDNFSTSLFVSTGNPRWGYDPYSYSYYDYQRHAYYDPYLYGYYPVGYRPPVVYGTPHPHGWSRGRGYIRPPSRIYDRRVSNYRDRVSGYRNSNYDWARQVRDRPAPAGRVTDSRPATTRYERQLQDRRNSNVRPSSRSSSRENAIPNRSSRPATRSSQPTTRYNTPVSTRERQVRTANVPQRRSQQGARQANRGGRPQIRESRPAARESRQRSQETRENREQRRGR